MERYGELIEQIEAATSSGNKDYRERMVTIQSKQYRDIIIRTGKFLNSVESFVEDVFNAEKNGEHVSSNPSERCSSARYVKPQRRTSRDALLILKIS
jgi:hypothetical protein